MTAFTPQAEARLDEYLRQVRAAVARAPEISPDEVEADIREHIAAEFRGAVAPVGLAPLEAVLVRLGPPTQWVPAGAPPAIPSVREWVRLARRNFLGILWRGPEDWRLPYLAFGVFALGVVAFPLFPLCLVVSYLLARAGMAAAAEKGIALGARRWLVYPPVALVGTALLLVALLWLPLIAGVVSAVELEEADKYRELIAVREDGTLTFTRPLRYEMEPFRLGVRKANGRWEILTGRREYYETLNRAEEAFPGPPAVQHGLFIAFAVVGAALAWAVVAGGITWAFPGLPRVVFTPLCNGFEAQSGRRLFTIGLIGLVIWAGFAYRLVPGAIAPGPERPVAQPVMHPLLPVKH